MKKACILTVFSLLFVIVLPSYIYPQQSRNDKAPLEVSSLMLGNGGQEDLYFIFINGLDCKCDGTRYNDMGFEVIRRNMARAGFTFTDNRFLLYSYTGGKVERGRWYPNKYESKDTGQPLQISVKNLELLVREYSSSHPKASFILIGHSLGGRIAMDFVSSTSEEMRKKIGGVVTLNSPLSGASFKVPEMIMEVFSKIDFILSSPAVRYLIWESKNLEENTYKRRKSIEELQKGGLRVATFATNQDMVVHAQGSCILDETGKPVSEGYILNVNRLPAKHFVGHMQILKHEEVSMYLVNLYIESILKK
ncbi:PGAP1-like alpha/beta domain-containing protein [Desulforamulus aquiferis]|uniref:GPI inositol-deacylase PGAP1-like alpha/beta domain-containing protein n=1 Tax=Desulforamulus aquiferis TaxID=1397668 RepID=A0AAW7ZGS1_9FIRM|nr:hypothetical protein [Desulforamulus aquiferis]MDO7788531.1 hypothetical protein [Desulforamulus aquiferis]RYD05041.1 hypothetical protein N752_11335 [Desulforamulus aquiferis]